MKNITLAALLLAPLPVIHAADIRDLRCEHGNNPLDIDVARPRLSWVIESGRRGESQSAYQVLVASSEELLKKNERDLWDSGKVESEQSVQVEYVDKPLAIDLNEIRELAEVHLKSRSLGVVWSPPFRVELPAAALKPAGNLLEIEVVNFWPNRIIGEASLPPEKRLTKTNLRELSAKTPLIVSSLLGPVRLPEKLTP